MTDAANEVFGRRLDALEERMRASYEEANPLPDGPTIEERLAALEREVSIIGGIARGGLSVVLQTFLAHNPESIENVFDHLDEVLDKQDPG